MRERTVRNTDKEKLRPTPEQARALDAVVWRCRARYHTALAPRITAWQRSRSAALHAHLLQDVVARLDQPYQACFRRLPRGEQAGFPRFKGRHRFPSFPSFKEEGH